MEGAIFACPAEWPLPEGILRLTEPAELSGREWPLLALTVSGVRRLLAEPVRCQVLLVPGDCPREMLSLLAAERVVTYGLSARDSITLSSLREPVLCVQRTLPRPDGAVVEPQEFPLPDLPGQAEELLPLLGLRLLQMPLTDGTFFW
ncbi:hypothetical protein [uncultured Dysosmobacter sp.]|uniref:hypothetical protein n=1 Tax=uncultured Dysosmobacter sp. TaxID=2591384 RepID=UPI002602D740|nr:hypothetical protein [uncultured Dysosmobacter sp.]